MLGGEQQRHYLMQTMKMLYRLSKIMVHGNYEVLVELLEQLD
jgi:hypothetical protein